jgi:hypothetical protein
MPFSAGTVLLSPAHLAVLRRRGCQLGIRDLLGNVCRGQYLLFPNKVDDAEHPCGSKGRVDTTLGAMPTL